MKISKYYDKITNDKDYEKKIFRRSNFKIFSFALVIAFTILFIITMVQSLIWTISGTSKKNVLGIISLIGYVFSIILLIISDEIQPLKDIPDNKDQFFVLLYIIQQKLDSVNENKMLSLERVCFYYMIHLAIRYLYKMECYYNNIFLSGSEGEQKLVISNLRMMLSKKLDKLLKNKSEFKNLINLYIDTYMYEIDDDKIPQGEYKRINDCIGKINNLLDNVSDNIDKNKKVGSINAINLIKKSVILVLVIAGVYFAGIVLKNDANSSVVANLYTVIGTTVSLIIAVYTLSVKK